MITRLQTVDAEKQRLSDELTMMREQLTASKQTTSIMLRGAVDEFNLERLSLEKDLERLKAERDELCQTNVTLMGELKSTQNDLSAMRLTLTQQTSEASQAIDAVNKSKKQLREEHGFEIERLSTSCARLEAELRESEHRLEKELAAAQLNEVKWCLVYLTAGTAADSVMMSGQRAEWLDVLMGSVSVKIDPLQYECVGIFS